MIPNAEQYRYVPYEEGWFYSDMVTTIDSITKAGFTFIEDAIPHFRDTLAAFKK